MERNNRSDWPFGFCSALEDNPAAMREFKDCPELQIPDSSYTFNAPFQSQYLLDTWLVDDYGFPYNYNTFIM